MARLKKQWLFTVMPRITGAGGLPTISGDSDNARGFAKWLEDYEEKSNKFTRIIRVKWGLDGKTEIEKKEP